VVYAYGDDGSDEKKERVTAVAVIAGYDTWWEEVEPKWIARCNGIPFHAKDCESDQNDYKDTPHQENKAMYRDLVTLLAQSKLGGIGIAIDLVAQKTIFPNSLPLAYYRAFLETLQRTAVVAGHMGEVAELNFDISTENEFNAGLLYSYMREGETDLFNWLHPKISFVCAKDCARVQMADLLTYEAWKALDHTVGPIKRTRKSWAALRSTGRFETYSYSEGWFNDLKQDLSSGALEKKVGFNQGDYQKWLTDRRRQHNLSNLFTFLDWIRRRDEGQLGV